MRLIVVRHGETANNAEQRFTGQMDAPLNGRGVRQARAVAEALAGERFELVVASDLMRARQTAAAIAECLDMAVTYDSDLREIAVGEWEGLTGAEIRARYPGALARWDAGAVTFAPPGGESVTQLAERVARALERSREAQPDGTVLWVTHGVVAGVLICQVLGIDLAHRSQFRRDNAAITELVVSDHGGILVRLNDTHHLAGLGSGERAQVM
ncbi:MAG TPA: histidine phosphatase family protein [Ktedonobacterales bacterium]|nr:histidine phosphatase family protein [Ktedonobacterales bacterium]